MQNTTRKYLSNSIDGIRKRSKCMWYEFGKKSSKFFLNLEKNCAIQDQVRTIVSN